MYLKYRYLILGVFLCALSERVSAQAVLTPSAKFSFNDKKDYDEVSNAKAKLHNVNFASDRFGNENSAVYLFGNEYSYINLGTYEALKPIEGTISFWIKVENESWSGIGRVMNPFILTKNNNESDDFYEAYAIGYYPETKKVIAICTQDSTKEISISSIEQFQLFTWHHLVITYSDHYFSLYIDGELEKKLDKNFSTGFSTTDSVIVGVTANKKNHRFLNATVDDIEFYKGVLTSDEIEALYHAPNPNKMAVLLHKIFISLIVLAIILSFYFLIRYQATLRLKKEKAALELANKLLETELRVNRALMNPHFVFNSLNTLQDLILNKEVLQANNYLIKFSKLIRKILETNMSNVISLETEIEMITRYLEIEDMRFRETIVHSIEIDPAIMSSTIYIPVMLIQPFVENAIWHGLLRKTGEKILKISFCLHKNVYLLCTVDDNGGGRKKTEYTNLEKKSLAIQFVLQRLELLNKLYNLNCTLSIVDKPLQAGTTVKILLPILNIQHVARNNN